MTAQEKHAFGIEIVCGCLQKEGYTILDAVADINTFPSIIARKNGEMFFVATSTDVAPRNGALPEHIKAQLIQHSKKHKAIPCFASVGIGACDSVRFDASLALRNDAYYANYKGLVELI